MMKQMKKCCYAIGILVMSSLATCSIERKEVKAKVQYDYLDWQSANGVCTLIGSNSAFASTDLVITDNDIPNNLAWIGAYVEYTPWIKLIGCYEFDASTIAMISSNVSRFPNDVSSCFSYCNGFRTFALSAQYCFCIDVPLEKNAKCQPTICGGTETDFCGTNIRAGSFGIVIYEIDPGEFDGVHDCVASTYNGNKTLRNVYFDGATVVPCSENNGYVCRTVESFPKNHTVVYFETPRGSWQDAANTCVSKSYNLAEFTSFWFPRRIPLPANGSKFWVGTFRRHALRFSTVSDFLLSTSTKNCVALELSEDGIFNMVIRSCSDRLPSLCDAANFPGKGETPSSTLPGEYIIVIIVMSALMVISILVSICIWRKCLRIKATEARQLNNTTPSESVNQANDFQPKKSLTQVSICREKSLSHEKFSKIHHSSSMNSKRSLKNSGSAGLRSLIRKTGSLNLSFPRSRKRNFGASVGSKDDLELRGVINLYSKGGSETLPDSIKIENNQKELKPNGTGEVFLSDGEYFILETVNNPSETKVTGNNNGETTPIFHVREKKNPIYEDVKDPPLTGYDNVDIQNNYFGRPRAETNISKYHSYKEKFGKLKHTFLHKTYSQPTYPAHKVMGNKNSIPMKSFDSVGRNEMTGKDMEESQRKESEIHSSGEYFILEKTVNTGTRETEKDRVFQIREAPPVYFVLEKADTNHEKKKDLNATASVYQDVDEIQTDMHKETLHSKTKLSASLKQKSQNTKSIPLNKTYSEPYNSTSASRSNFLSNSMTHIKSTKNNGNNSMKSRADLSNLEKSSPTNRVEVNQIFQFSECTGNVYHVPDSSVIEGTTITPSVYHDIETINPDLVTRFLPLRKRAKSSISNFLKYKRKKNSKHLPIHKTLSQPVSSVSGVPPPLPRRNPETEVAASNTLSSKAVSTTVSSSRGDNGEEKRPIRRKTVRFRDEAEKKSKDDRNNEDDRPNNDNRYSRIHRFDDQYDHVEIDNKRSRLFSDASDIYDTMESVRKYLVTQDRKSSLFD